MLKIRRPLGRLIFNMGIAIPGKTVFLIDTAPWSFSDYLYITAAAPPAERQSNMSNSAYGLEARIWYFTVRNVLVYWPPTPNNHFRGFCLHRRYHKFIDNYANTSWYWINYVRWTVILKGHKSIFSYLGDYLGAPHNIRTPISYVVAPYEYVRDPI